MKANRLQLLLIPDPLSIAQVDLPPNSRDESLELIAMILLNAVRDEAQAEANEEVVDESR